MAHNNKRDWLEPPDWWKKWRPLRLLALVALAGGIYSWLDLGSQAVDAIRAPHPETADFVAVEIATVGLIEPFKSYSSLLEVQTELKKSKFNWVLQSVPTPGTPDHPPRNLDSMVVNGFTHLGVAGELTLEFFNDRLFETSFIPSDPAAYAPQLRSYGLIPEKTANGRAEIRAKHRRVISNVELATSEVGRNIGTIPQVIWQDLRMIAQRDDWDFRFGTQPLQ